MTSPFLRLENLSKSFGDVRVLDGVDLTLAEGEILALLGLSGSGKTTALRITAGFETPDQGRVVIAGDDITASKPAARGFGMVFQHYALFPHMSVAANIAFGLEAQGMPKTQINERVDEMLELVDLAGFGERAVSAISGGQQQRVALARALAPSPRVLLLDEPLSNLDPALRVKTRRQLADTVRQIGITTLIVTHEQEEAFDLGDRVAVLNGGRLEQVGTPEDLYRRPASRFVATFVGRASVIPGVVADVQGQKCTVRLAGDVVWPAMAAQPVEAGQEVDLVIRPEALLLHDNAMPGSVEATVIGRQFTGPLTYAVVTVNGAEVEAVITSDRALEVGATGHLVLRADADVPLPRVFTA